MAYDILSIGDAEMLYNTFNGAAMIFASDNMRTLIKIGFLIGVFLVGFHYYYEMKFPLGCDLNLKQHSKFWCS